jgi:hypothetical protein
MKAIKTASPELAVREDISSATGRADIRSR